MSPRLTSVVTSLPDFVLGSSNKSFKHQYANIYFIRLRRLRGCVEKNAAERWKNVKDSPGMVPRVLDVKKGQLCWVVGTVYMDMLLKPNILEDIGRDFSIPPPPPPPKYLSTNDIVILEDESGRLTLVGDRLKREQFVTGIIMAALGMETPDGQFEVIDLCFPGLAPQQSAAVTAHSGDDMEVDEPSSSSPGSWIALLSGLELSSTNPKSSETELYLQLLAENILGESGDPSDQTLSSQISRVIFVGNTMSVGNRGSNTNNKQTPSTSTEQGTLTVPPTAITSKFLQELALALPVHILPGPSDPSGTILPQQPLPRAMFGAVRKYTNFSCETNPALFMVDDQKMLLTSGQPLDDMFKYIDSTDRLALAVKTLEWRHIAPTAPDTLWCYPYLTQDPFILESTPRAYIIGNQPSFATTLVESKIAGHVQSRKRDERGDVLGDHVKCRVILLPKFCETPILVLLHTKTLECKTIEVDVHTSLLPKGKY